MRQPFSNRWHRAVVGDSLRATIVMVVCLLTTLIGCDRDNPSPVARGNAAATQPAGELVIYCSHDRIYSEIIFTQFTAETGIKVRAKYDSELTKSLGLVQQIMQEKDAPRCDVFWNNEPMGTMDLQDAGLLEPYKGRAWNYIPANWRDADGHWVGFAARFRVSIVNRFGMGAFVSWIRKDGKRTMKHVAIAKPLFGTTRAHYTALWATEGGEYVKKWHQQARELGVTEARSNGHVKNLVASGACDVGWTDTDDFYEAKDQGKDVRMSPMMLHRRVFAASQPADSVELLMGAEPSPATREARWTICLPNTLAIIKGSGQVANAQRFIDWLASEQGEILLANGSARQVPLGSVDPGKLPPEVVAMLPWVADGVPLSVIATARRECLAWLQSEYAK